MTLRRRRATDWRPQVPDHQETGRVKFFNPGGESQEKHRPGVARPIAFHRCRGIGTQVA